MNLGLVKFKYGEEIICEYEYREMHLYVKNTAALLPTENLGWNLVTWMPYTDVKNGFLLPKEQIWFITPLSKDMEEYYFNWKEALFKIRTENKTE